MSILIKDTTPMERIQIVKDCLEGEYDEFYDDYVSGKKELAELNSQCSDQYASDWKDYVVGLGEILFDCFERSRKLGGAPANFAYHASQLGLNGMAVSAVGADALGEEVRSQLAAKNLKAHLEQVDYPTGTVRVTLTGEGIPQYEICEDVAYDHIPWNGTLEAIARQARAVCFGTLAQRSAPEAGSPAPGPSALGSSVHGFSAMAFSRDTVRRFLASMPAGSLKVFDINLRQHFYTRELIESCLDACNVLKINDEEISVVAGLLGLSAADYEVMCRELMRRYALRMVILTCGATGSYVFAEGETSYLDTPKVEVVDTVGAGDSFTAAFCCGLLRGKPVAEAHRDAVRVAAYVCTQPGAMPSLPPDFFMTLFQSRLASDLTVYSKPRIGTPTSGAVGGTAPEGCCRPAIDADSKSKRFSAKA